MKIGSGTPLSWLARNKLVSAAVRQRKPYSIDENPALYLNSIQKSTDICMAILGMRRANDNAGFS